MIILIPCKHLDHGKSRLSGCLDARSRRALCEFFLCRTLALATAVAAPDRVRLITSDQRAMAIARDYAVATLADPGGGLNAALDQGRNWVVAGGAEHGLLVLPIDLPDATPDALAAVLAQRFDVVIAADEEGSGTNLLGLQPNASRQFPFAFGPGSYAKHCDAARRAGLGLHTIGDRRIAFDVDRPDHLARWSRRDRIGRGDELVVDGLAVN